MVVLNGLRPRGASVCSAAEDQFHHAIDGSSMAEDYEERIAMTGREESMKITWHTSLGMSCGSGRRAPAAWCGVLSGVLLGMLLFSVPVFTVPAVARPLLAQAATNPSTDGAAPAAAPAGVEEPAAESPSVAPAAAPDGGAPANSTSAQLPSNLPRDLTPWGMFLTAVIPVKLVLIGLAFASLVTWTIWLAKTIEIWTAKRLARRSFATLAKAVSLAAAAKALADERSPVARFAAAAMGEASRSEGLAAEGVKDRTATLLSRIEAQAGRAIMRGTGPLATIGATAPFIGLFGTVWGIMDSFIGISKTNTTSLAVVAPGIAEALLATAMGLIAAIPAVVMYNAFARAITGYRAQLGDAAAEVLRHLSRDLDRKELPSEDSQPVARLHRSAE